MAKPGGGPLRSLRLVLWLAVLLAAGAALYLYTNKSAPTDNGEGGTQYAASVGGPFTLTGADGAAVTQETLRGKPYAIFFGFTRCPDVCPTSLARLAQLRKRLGADGDRFRIVFVSVDSGRDTPEDVGRYVEMFGTPILGLTGTKAQIDAVTKAYKVFYEKVPAKDANGGNSGASGDYTVDHTASVFLMDARGQLQSIIDYHESADASLAKLRRLVED